MNHVTIDNLDEIMDVFKQYSKIFPHIRSDKIQRMIESNNVVWEEKVLITYNHYQRRQRVGKIRRIKKVIVSYIRLFLRTKAMVVVKRVFENFITFQYGRDVVLSVRSEKQELYRFIRNMIYQSK